MIKKLRIKFIIASMASILFVLVATIGAINISNYVSVQKEVNNALTLVIENGLNDEPQQGGGPGGKQDNIQREHYFVVAFNSDGTVNQSNFKHIFIVNETTGIELATSVFNGVNTHGKIDNLYYQKANKGNLIIVAFVDAKDRLDSFNNFLISSILIASISYVVIFVLIFFSSKIVFRVSEESYQKQKSFITNASHELKTPLTIISTDLELIEMDNGKSEWTASIKDQVNRLTKMTNQLVVLSRLDEADYSKYPFEEFSLSEVANDVTDSFAQSFKKESLIFKTDVEENLVLNGNKYLIEELFFIFLDNALKYTKENGEAGVLVSKDKKNKPCITFYNSVDSDLELDISLLFERFYRSPNSKKEGSGIGLSIAKEILNLHKANIKVTKENNILKFFITF